MSVQRITVLISIVALCLLQQAARGSAWSPARIAPSMVSTPTTTSHISPAATALLSESENRRRSLFVTASALVTSAIIVPSLPAKADTGAEVRGTKLTPLNGLAFNYRGTDYGGLTAAEINEPSISYADFMVKLKAGEVELVEFLAPDGDTAYATLKPKVGAGKESPIRIGEGYPVEQHDGFSSPAFAVRAVKNAGVAYKFTVPALQAYKK
jgi:hypothetical protein